MTFFTKYGPAPCDKNCRSEHQTLFPLFGEGLGTGLVQAFSRFSYCKRQKLGVEAWERGYEALRSSHCTILTQRLWGSLKARCPW